MISVEHHNSGDDLRKPEDDERRRHGDHHFRSAVLLRCWRCRRFRRRGYVSLTAANLVDVSLHLLFLFPGDRQYLRVKYDEQAGHDRVNDQEVAKQGLNVTGRNGGGMVVYKTCVQCRTQQCREDPSAADECGNFSPRQDGVVLERKDDGNEARIM